MGEGDTTEFELIVSVLIDACLYWSRNCRVTQFQTLKVFGVKTKLCSQALDEM